jgi:hypothetical protein
MQQMNTLDSQLLHAQRTQGHVNQQDDKICQEQRAARRDRTRRTNKERRRKKTKAEEKDYE